MTSDNGELPSKVQGLPVAGYRAQSPRSIDAVNAVKQIEERVLRLLDEVSADPKLAADGRLLAIGRTQIELGFMAVNKSIFKPGRVDLADGVGIGPFWVLELEDSDPAKPSYFAPIAHGAQWTADRNIAVRFARCQDAERLAAAIGFRTRVTMSGASR